MPRATSAGVMLRAMVAALVLAATACSRDDAPAAPSLQGALRISGSPADRALLDAWQASFTRLHPDVVFTQSLHGPESTLAPVYTGTADVALMGRELREPLERMAFEWVRLDKPLAIPVAEAGLASDRLSTQIGVFVHADNPITGVSLRQLDAVYGAERRRGGAAVSAWGDLGLDGDWASRPVHVYGPPVDSLQAIHLRRQVLEDSRKWTPEYRPSASEGADVVAALAADRDGIAYAPVRDATPAVRLIGLARDDAGPFLLPDEAAIRSRAYPLVRSIVLVTAHTKQEPMTPLVRAFVAHVLGDEGQAVLAREGGYLPLGDAALAEARGRLP
ncbi:PstS family phosphate ABC transporter substrate-binding protein [Dokdonella sp. MW10]|uniref:PstS family phosphate ABC transporter substrate-binding protein n=1 Tax=Dokdonella sp. MW10 TaxID=2992926 RepID=UPI003F813871